MRSSRPRAARAAGLLGALALALLLVLCLRSVAGIHTVPVESSSPDVALAGSPTSLNTSASTPDADVAVEATPVRRRHPVAPATPVVGLLAAVVVVLAAAATRETWGPAPESGLRMADSPPLSGRGPPSISVA